MCRVHLDEEVLGGTEAVRFSNGVLSERGAICCYPLSRWNEEMRDALCEMDERG